MTENLERFMKLVKPVTRCQMPKYVKGVAEKVAEKLSKGERVVFLHQRCPGRQSTIQELKQELSMKNRYVVRPVMPPANAEYSPSHLEKMRTQVPQKRRDARYVATIPSGSVVWSLRENPAILIVARPNDKPLKINLVTGEHEVIETTLPIEKEYQIDGIRPTNQE